MNRKRFALAIAGAAFYAAIDAFFVFGAITVWLAFGTAPTIGEISAISAPVIVALVATYRLIKNIITIRVELGVEKKAKLDREIIKRAAELVKKEEESKKEETANQA